MTHTSQIPHSSRRALRAIRWTTIMLSLVLATAHVAFPDVAIDYATLALLLIALAAFVLPALTILFPRLKRVRLGSLEFELSEGLAKLATDTDRAKEVSAPFAIPGADVQQTSSKVEQIIKDAAQDPRAALLLLNARIETAIRSLARNAELPDGTHLTLPRLLEHLADRKIVSPQILGPFREFRAIRNRIAHEAQFDVSPGALYSLIDSGATILELLEASNAAPGIGPDSA